MRPSPFKIERYYAKYEFSAPYLISGSDCESLTIGELLALEPDATLARLSLGRLCELMGDPDEADRLAAERPDDTSGLLAREKRAHARGSGRRS